MPKQAALLQAEAIWARVAHLQAQQSSGLFRATARLGITVLPCPCSSHHKPNAHKVRLESRESTGAAFEARVGSSHPGSSVQPLKSAACQAVYQATYRHPNPNYGPATNLDDHLDSTCPPLAKDARPPKGMKLTCHFLVERHLKSDDKSHKPRTPARPAVFCHAPRRLPH